MPYVASRKHPLIRSRPGVAARASEIAGQGNAAQEKRNLYSYVRVAQEAHDGAGLLNTRQGFTERRKIARHGQTFWKFVGGRASPAGASQRFFAATVFDFQRQPRGSGSSRIETQSRSAFVEHGSEVPRSRRANPRRRIHGLPRQGNWR